MKMMTKQDELQNGMVQKGIKFYETETIGYYDLSIRFGKCKTTIELWKALYPEYPKNHPKILIAYPDNKLRDTWLNEMELWNYDRLTVLLTNFSSLKNYVDMKFDHFVCDEFHATSEKEREYCQEIIKNSGRTTCLSGTVDQETRSRWNIPCIGKYTTEQGVEDGILADYKVTVHLVDLDKKIKVKEKNGKTRSEKEKYDAYSWVIEDNKKKGKDSMFLSLARNRIGLNSIGKREYVKELLKGMDNKRVVVFTGLTEAADSLGIPSYHSKTKKENTSFLDFQNCKINKLALSAMGKVGVTYPKLDSVVLTNFTYNSKETKQILQRAIKLDYSGKVADLHLIVINEKPELKKYKESLSMLNQENIVIYGNSR